MNPSGEGIGKQFEKKRITELSYLINYLPTKVMYLLILYLFFVNPIFVLILLLPNSYILDVYPKNYP